MKKVILLLLVFQYGFSQCDKIENTYDEMKDVRTIKTPYKSRINAVSGTYKLNGFLEAIKIIKKEQSSALVVFTGYGTTPNYNAKGLYIKLSNGEILRFEDIKVDSKYSSSGMYTYTAYLDFDKAISLKINENKILQFTLSNTEFKVKDKDAAEFLTYFNCILKM